MACLQTGCASLGSSDQAQPLKPLEVTTSAGSDGAVAEAQPASASASTAENNSWEQPATPLLVTGGAPVDTLAEEARKAEEERLETEPQVRIYGGDGVLLNKPRKGAALTGQAGEFNFEEAPIAEVVHVMMGDVLQANYVLHQPISGTLTLSTKKSISKEDAVSLLETALMANGLVMAQDSRGFYHVGRPEALRGIVPAPRLVGNGPLPPGVGAILIQLDYIGANEMAEILKPVLQPESLVRVDTTRNMLVLSGTRTQAEGWMELVRTFDVDLLKGMSVGIFPLRYTTAADIQLAMSVVAGGGDLAAAAAARPAQGNQQQSASQQAAAQRAAAQQRQGAAGQQQAAAQSASPQVMPFLGSVKILPLERLNSVMVVTTKASHLESVREWIERLDQPNDSAEPQLFVYGVQNGSAAHLAEVLGGIFGGSKEGGGAVMANSGVAPGLNQASNATSGFNSAFANNANSRFGSGAGLGGLNTGSANANQQARSVSPVAMDLNGIRVIADPLNNAILVWGTRQDFRKIEATLKQLDRPPVQVVLEASIIEVTLSDGLDFGLRWAFTGDLGSGYDSAGGWAPLGATNTSSTNTSNNMSLLSSLASANGFSYAITRGQNISAMLNMLATRSLVKVLSSPSLLVLDNHTASITVGDQVPVRTSTTSYLSSNGTTQDSYQYRDTGVILQVTPSVNSGDLVTLTVDQSVVNIGSGAATTANPTFMQRNISSKVAVRSGEPIVLGGLIKEGTRNDKDGIPGLVDVPVVGNVFGKTSKANERTELLVLITPRVIRSDNELKDATDELKGRMQTLLRARAEDIRKGGTVLPGEEDLADLILGGQK